MMEPVETRPLRFVDPTIPQEQWGDGRKETDAERRARVLRQNLLGKPRASFLERYVDRDRSIHSMVEIAQAAGASKQLLIADEDAFLGTTLGDSA
jgi:hypothetical protein